MSDRVTTARQRIDAWREQHADRFQPVRFHHMDALERRAAGHAGDVRRLLDERLASLIAAYAADLERATPAPTAAACTAASTGLRPLIGILANQAAAPADNSYPELPALDDFRRLWSTLRTESQLRQSLKQAPTDAGPLNSGTLVHRSIALMRDVSPAYLQHFVAYVDALSWMEQMGYSTPAAAEAPRAPGSGRKRAAKPRTRQD